MKIIKNACVQGDRVMDNNTKSIGIVMNLDLKGFEGMPRANVHWTDCSKSLIGDLVDGWICEGNLTILDPEENLIHRNH